MSHLGQIQDNQCVYLVPSTIKQIFNFSFYKLVTLRLCVNLTFYLCYSDMLPFCRILVLVFSLISSCICYLSRKLQTSYNIVSLWVPVGRILKQYKI